MKKIFVIAALAGIVFAGCKKEVPVTAVQNDGQQEISFNALSKAVTRGVLTTGTAFDTPMETSKFRDIIVAGSIKQSDGQIADFLEATKFKQSTDNVWKAENKAYYPLGVKGDDCRFLAYSETYGCKSPARWYGSKEVEINVSEQCDTNEIVYSGFKGAANKAETATATFKRTQALVSVNIKAKDTDIAGSSIKINKIGFRDVKTSGTLLLKVNPKSDNADAEHQWIYNAGCTCHFAEMSGYKLRENVDGTSSATNKEVGFDEVIGTEVTTTPATYKDALGLPLSEDGFQLDRLFPAQELQAKVIVVNYTLGDLTTDVELVLDGTSSSADTNTGAAAPLNPWEAGKHYVYNIKVNLIEISIDPVSPQAWTVTETTYGQYDNDSVTP